METPLDGAATSDSAVRLARLSEFIQVAEPAASQAREFTYRAACYRRNFWLVEYTDDGSLKILDEEQKGAGREYWSVPWTLFLGLVRSARYTSLRPSWQLRYGAEREQERYIDEQAYALITRHIDPERERIQPLLADSMTFSGHSVLKVTWDANSGPVERVAVETDEPTNTKLRVEKVIEEVGVTRERKIEKSQIVYHAVDENNRLKYVERHLGAPKFEVLGPTDYNIDPNAGAEGMARARYAYDCRRVSADEIYEKFPDAKGKLANLEWSQSLVCSDTEQRIRTARSQVTTSDAVKSAVLIDFYLKPSPAFGFKNGLHAVFAIPDFSTDTAMSGGVILAWEDWPWASLPYKDGAVGITDTQDYWGSMLFLVTAPSQREYNELMTIAIDNAKIGASVVIGATQTEGIPGGVMAQQIPGMPFGRLLLWGRNVQDVKVLANLGATGQQVELAQLVRGVGEATSAARTAGSSELATKLVMDATQDKAVLDSAVAGFTRCITNATLYAVELFRRHMGLKELKNSLPDFSDGDLKEFLNSQPLSTLRITTKQVTLMDDPEAAVTILKILPQFGPDALKIFKPDYLADLLQMQRRFGESVRDLEQFKARRENTMLRYGKKVLTSPTDDDEAHLDEMDYYDGHHSLQMTEQEAKRRFVHRTAHEDQMDKKLVKKALRTARAQLAAELEINALKQQVSESQPTAPVERQVPGGG